MVRVIQITWLGVKLATPWVIRAFLFTVRLTLLGFAGVWFGIPATSQRIANEWLDRAVRSGFPTQWDRQLYYVLYIMAFGVVMVGWILLSFVTTWIVKLFFT